MVVTNESQILLLAHQHSLLVSRTLSLAFFSKKRRVSGVGATQQNQRVGIIAMLQLRAVHVLLLAFSRNQLLRKQSWKFALSRPLHVHFQFVFIRAVFPDLLPWPQVRLPRSKFCRVLILLFTLVCARCRALWTWTLFFFVLLFVFFFCVFCARPVSAKSKISKTRKSSTKKETKSLYRYKLWEDALFLTDDDRDLFWESYHFVVLSKNAENATTRGECLRLFSTLSLLFFLSSSLRTTFAKLP